MKRKTLIIIGGLVVLLISVVFFIRFVFGGSASSPEGLPARGEDDWICSGSGWVKHGNPTAAMPTSGCNVTTGKITPKEGEFSNGQKYEVFKESDFEVKYPFWPNVDPKNILEPANIELAVTNEGCNLMITSEYVPESKTYATYTQELLDKPTKYKTQIISKKIDDKIRIVEAEVVIGGVTVKSVSYGYLTSKRNSYGIGFLAEKTKFDSGCSLIISEVISSVKVN